MKGIDHELLLLAAKAAPHISEIQHINGDGSVVYISTGGSANNSWRPYDDDGHTLQLLADLKLTLHQTPRGVCIHHVGTELFINELDSYNNGCRRTTIRHAVLRAAAAIGATL